MRSGRYFIISFLIILSVSGCEKSIDGLFFEADQFQSKKEYVKATEVYTQILKRNSKIQKAFFDRGMCFLRMREYSKAISDFNSIIILRGGDGMEFHLNEDIPFASEEAHYQIGKTQAIKNRGIAYFFSDSLDLAYADMNRAVKSNFELGNSLIWQGNIAYKKNEVETACNLFEKARQLNYPEADSFLLKYCNSTKLINKPL